LDHDRLTHLLASLAEVLFTQQTLKGDLERHVRLACAVIPRCSGASIGLLVEGEPTTVAVTDRVTLELDVVQYDNSEGPCLTALGGDMIRIGFVADDERFPHFAVGAADRRVLSVLSTPIRYNGTIIGTLNVYSHERDAFDFAAEQMALVFAAEAAAALAKSDLYQHARSLRQRLQEEHDTSAQVAWAEGALMTMQECSADQARALLGRAADTNGEPLLDVARRILAAAQEHNRSQADPSTSSS